VASLDGTSIDQLRLLLRAEAIRMRDSREPLNLIGLLRELGVTLSSSGEIGAKAQGLLRSHNDRWEIVLQSSYPTGTAQRLSGRDRFTVAHELGHLVLYRSGVAGPRTRSDYWRLEEVCNWFAGQLLISDFELEGVFLSGKATTAAELLLKTKQLSKTLFISFEACARRVTEWVVGSALVRVRVPSGDHPVPVVEWATESKPWLIIGRGKRLTSDHPLFDLVVEHPEENWPAVKEATIPPDVTIASQRLHSLVDVAARIS
jgi:hypothetical protein